MTVLLAIVGALILLALIFIVSMRLTERKSTEDLSKRIPDASSVNADSGYATPVGGD